MRELSKRLPNLNSMANNSIASLADQALDLEEPSGNEADQVNTRSMTGSGTSPPEETSKQLAWAEWAWEDFVATQIIE